ncbi:type 12 methyltransferase [Neptunitalea chrysea]|uniref:Type 12 methyltransferase n=1 Tax=Neptunitalea chrysea TaxID=1647581 RepID=A0A9W6B4E6_9FLAO|nr:class I SAM-dependent methyltransferase [Neptunitalea chrysea]GLB52443.1 type 12 methyltransferase [Neptunitalea chrysea]
MNPEEDYINVNRTTWNRKTDFHLASEFYDVAEFIKGKCSLNDIELNLLGDLKGKTILHLQCHFGQDTISLSRLGAKATGVDLSDKAIDAAKELADKTNTDTQFICCNIYDLPKHLNQQFDMVFTSYGTIGWLPDLDQWAKLISTYLKPGGQFVFAEFHPVVWMFDYDFKGVAYNYFKSDTIIETESGTYADTEANITTQTITWNHAMSEVITSLINNGLQLNILEEFDYSPYNCFNHTVEVSPGKFRIQHLEDKIPMVYALKATKP